MDPMLLSRRQRAVARHDAAVRTWPEADSVGFRDEMVVVVGELQALTVHTPAFARAAVEWSRTWCYLGDAWSDVARAVGGSHDLLRQAWSAYEQAESLLEGARAPMDRARLLFNSAHTLWALGGSDDVALLRQALGRMAEARALFQSHQPKLVGRAEDALEQLARDVRAAEARHVPRQTHAAPYAAESSGDPFTAS